MPERGRRLFSAHRSTGTWAPAGAVSALLARFNRLEDRLIRRADEFTAEADLTGPDDLETALVDLDRELAVERELAALKAE